MSSFAKSHKLRELRRFCQFAPWVVGANFLAFRWPPVQNGTMAKATFLTQISAAETRLQLPPVATSGAARTKPLRAEHPATDLAAQAVLLPLTLLASMTLTLTLLLGSSQTSWPHPLLAAQAGLACSQLAVMALLVMLSRRVSWLCVTGLVALAIVWMRCLGVHVLDDSAWLILLGGYALLMLASLGILKSLGLRLVATFAKSDPLGAHHDATGERRSPWQFSLASVLALTTVSTMILAAIRAVLPGATPTILQTPGLDQFAAGLTPLPFLVLALSLLMLGRWRDQRLFLVLAVCLAAALTIVALSRLEGDGWLPGVGQTLGFSLVFTSCYLCVIRQCGGRISWPDRAAAQVRPYESSC